MLHYILQQDTTVSFGLQSFPILFKRLHFFMGGTFSRNKFTQVSLIIITSFFNSTATRQGHSVLFPTWRLLPLKHVILWYFSALVFPYNKNEKSSLNCELNKPEMLYES